MPDLIITATDYHARVLREHGTQKALICSWRQFCEDWIEAQGIQVLNSFAEHLLWQEQVRHIDFPNLEALVAGFEESDHLMQLYGIDAKVLQSFDYDAPRLFSETLKRFEQALSKERETTFLRALKQLDPAKIPPKFKGKSIELFGFVDFPPLYRRLVEESHLDSRLRGNDSRCGNDIAAQVYEAQNSEEEFLFALEAIEQEWQKDRYKTFALVVHQSELSWKKIHRLLKTRESPMKVSCSKGEALQDSPKFLFLKDLFASLKSADLLEISRVLVSAFWPDDLARRARLDVWMRECLMRATTLPQVLKSLLHHEPEIQETLWFQAWAKLINFNEQERDAFISLFLSAAEYIDLAAPHVEHPNLHIVGVLEAANLPVDIVWLLSATDEYYPAKRTIPPFLSKAVLREHGVPIELEAAYRYGENLLHAICDERQVFASLVPMQRGEKKNLSRLLHGVRYPRASTCHSRVGRDPEHQRISLDSRLRGNDKAIPLPNQTNLLIKGGTALLKEQAECPFKAFAHFRLNVSELESGQEVLDPLQKGSIVHAVLEKIWNTLQTQQALQALSLEEERALIKAKIAETFSELRTTTRKSLIRKLEGKRLARIIEDWLSFEKARPPFAVKAAEVNELVSVSGLQFKIRLDRIDTIPDGEIIIDYKTGEVSSKNWFDERLRDPQLPLYAVTNAAAVGTIFASLKVGKRGFVGVVANIDAAFDRATILPDDKSWEAQRTEWKTQLELLVNEFREGHLDVAPIDEKACLYCDLTAFCRVKELKANDVKG